MIEKGNVVASMIIVNKNEPACCCHGGICIHLSSFRPSPMYDLDHRQYTDEIDDRSQAIVGVTKTVSRLPPSRTGPGVYISYATRGWVSRSKTKVSLLDGSWVCMNESRY